MRSRGSFGVVCLVVTLMAVACVTPTGPGARPALFMSDARVLFIGADPTGAEYNDSNYLYMTNAYPVAGMKFALNSMDYQGVLTNAMVQPSWATANIFWAPDLSFVDGVWALFFVAEPNASVGVGGLCIGVAIDRFGAPDSFVPDSTPVACGSVWDPDLERVAGTRQLMYAVDRCPK